MACFTTPVNADGMALYKAWIESDAFDIDRLVGEVEDSLVNMVMAASEMHQFDFTLAEGSKDPMELEGPVTDKKQQGVAHDQDDVDDLLSSLGF